MVANIFCVALKFKMEAFDRITTNLANIPDRHRNYIFSSLGGYAVGIFFLYNYILLAAISLVVLGVVVQPNMANLQADWNNAHTVGVMDAADFTKDTICVAGTLTGLFASTMPFISTFGLGTMTLLGYLSNPEFVPNNVRIVN